MDCFTFVRNDGAVILASVQSDAGAGLIALPAGGGGNKSIAGGMKN